MIYGYARVSSKGLDPDWKEGRHSVEYDADAFKTMRCRVDRGEITVTEAAAELGISRAKWYRLVKELAA